MMDIPVLCHQRLRRASSPDMASYVLVCNAGD